MRYAPGDILTTISDLEPTIKRGQYRFEREGADCILEDFIPTGPGHNPVVDRAVCVGFQKNNTSVVHFFRINKYRPLVMNHLYCNGMLKPSHRPSINKRWSYVALTCRWPRTEAYTPTKNHLHGSKSWRLAITDGWEMPFPVDEYNDCFPISSEHFMPFPLPVRTPIHFSLSPCYPTLGEQLPRNFKGLFSKPNSDPQEVDIILHGFLDPRKMHFGIRKHVLGCLGEPPQAQKAMFNRTIAKPLAQAMCTATPKEPDHWAILLGNDFHTRFSCATINQCPVLNNGAKAKNCPRCEKETFSRVQGELSSLVQAYCKHFVTIFENLQTQSDKDTALCVWSKDTFLADVGLIRLHAHYQPCETHKMMAVYDGVYYEGRGQNRGPVLHLCMLTLYFTDEDFFSKVFSPCGTIKLLKDTNQ